MPPLRPGLPSRHSLHPVIRLTDQHRQLMKKRFAAALEKIRIRPEALTAVAPQVPVALEFPLTTVSLNSNFDAYLSVGFPGSETSVELLVDSGNTTLILPRWEDIQAIPGYQANYQVLGQATEPWGCPANIVKGPIRLMASSGAPFTIADCIFYACTADSPMENERTSNFGAGCVTPWSASWVDAPAGLGITMQAPLSYSSYPVVEFDYAPASEIHPAGAAPAVPAGSILRLYQSAPAGYTLFDVLPDCAWMSLRPKSLSIEDTLTGWPGNVASPIAMVDTGGGPVYLSDPNNYVYSRQWPDPVANPAWAATSESCQSSGASLGIEIGDANGSYSYNIDAPALPAPAQGLTLVMCEKNEYMMDQQGMNIGGLSALENFILVDFSKKQVGFKPKSIAPAS